MCLEPWELASTDDSDLERQRTEATDFSLYASVCKPPEAAIGYSHFSIKAAASLRRKSNLNREGSIRRRGILYRVFVISDPVEAIAVLSNDAVIFGILAAILGLMFYIVAPIPSY